MFVGPQRLLARQQKDVVGSSVGLLAHSTRALTAAVLSPWGAQGQQTHPHLNLHFRKLNALHYQH